MFVCFSSNFTPLCPSLRAHRAETWSRQHREGWSLTTRCWSERLPAWSLCRRASCSVSRPTSPDNIKSWSVWKMVYVFHNFLFHSIPVNPCICGLLLHDSWPLNFIICALNIAHSAEEKRSKGDQHECALAVKRFCQNPCQLFLVVCSLIECKPQTIFLSTSTCRWPHGFALGINFSKQYILVISETWVMHWCVSVM